MTYKRYPRITDTHYAALTEEEKLILWERTSDLRIGNNITKYCEMTGRQVTAEQWRVTSIAMEQCRSRSPTKLEVSRTAVDFVEGMQRRIARLNMRFTGSPYKSTEEMQILLNKEGEDRVRAVLHWLYNDYEPNNKFDWRSVIQSATGLRRHFDKLASQMTYNGSDKTTTWTGR